MTAHLGQNQLYNTLATSTLRALVNLPIQEHATVQSTHHIRQLDIQRQSQCHTVVQDIKVRRHKESTHHRGNPRKETLETIKGWSWVVSIDVSGVLVSGKN